MPNNFEEMEKQQKELMDSINAERLNLENAVAETNKASAVLAEKQKEIENINTEIQKSSKKKDELSSSIVGLTEKLDSLKVDIGNSTISLDNKKQELESVTTKLSDLSSELNFKVNKGNIEYEEKTSEARKNLENVKSEILSIEKDLLQKKSYVDSIINKISELNKQKSDIDSLINDGNNEIIKLNLQIKSLNDSITAEKNKYNCYIEEAKKDIEELDKTKSILNEDIIAITKDKEKAIVERDAIIKNGASLLAREEYVNGQEIYLKEQFKRLGLDYQPYVKN